MGLFGYYDDGEVETAYSGFIWDPTTETWDEFPVPPITVLLLSQKDGYIAASGDYSFDTGPGVQPSAPGKRLFVLSPGSRDWAEWTFPRESGSESGWDYRFAAVRIG